MKMKIYLLRFAIFLTKTAQILQKIQPHFVKHEAILIIFQVIPESISQSNPLIWNSVSSDIKELKNYKKFRNNWKSSVLKCCG